MRIIGVITGDARCLAYNSNANFFRGSTNSRWLITAGASMEDSHNVSLDECSTATLRELLGSKTHREKSQRALSQMVSQRSMDRGQRGESPYSIAPAGSW